MQPPIAVTLAVDGLDADFEFRRVQRADVEELIVLQVCTPGGLVQVGAGRWSRDVASVTHPPLPTQNSLFEVKYDRHFYELLFRDNYTCTVVRERAAPYRLVAVSSVRLEDDEAGWWSRFAAGVQGKQAAYLLTLGVHPDCRKRGMARRLVMVRRVAPVEAWSAGCVGFPWVQTTVAPPLLTLPRAGRA